MGASAQGITIGPVVDTFNYERFKDSIFGYSNLCFSFCFNYFIISNFRYCTGLNRKFYPFLNIQTIETTITVKVINPLKKVFEIKNPRNGPKVIIRSEYQIGFKEILIGCKFIF